MTYRESVKQQNYVRKEMRRMEILLSTPHGRKKWHKQMAKEYKRAVRIDKINNLINLYGESSARCIIAVVVLHALGFVIMVLFLSHFPLWLSAFWSWIL
ncbi:MAG: hypothetical protein FWC71_02015 [Defluviitaleaceae bacterium]|nr:hypothetical protein [Defluviitaleaceae bacterium]